MEKPRDGISEIRELEVAKIRDFTMKTFRLYQESNQEFLDEIKSIADNNKSIEEAINKFGSIDTIFNEFTVVKWGNGAIEGDLLREIDGSIQNSTTHFANPDHFENAVGEWFRRMFSIKEKLKRFSGTSEEAYELIKKWHSDYVLKPINDTPIFQEI